LDASTGPNLQAALTRVETSQAALHGIIGLRSSTLQPALRQASSEGTAFIHAAKKIVRIQLGDTWNTKWFEAGFLNDTTVTPTTQAEREGLLKVLAKYFAADPTREAVNQEVTAARAQGLHAAIIKARKDVSDNKSAQTEAKAERDKAKRKLRQLIRSLVLDLEMALEPDSAAWTTFGLIAPAKLSNRRKRATKESGTTTNRVSTRATESAPGFANGSATVALAQ